MLLLNKATHAFWLLCASKFHLIFKKRFPFNSFNCSRIEYLLEKCSFSEKATKCNHQRQQIVQRRVTDGLLRRRYYDSSGNLSSCKDCVTSHRDDLVTALLKGHKTYCELLTIASSSFSLTKNSQSLGSLDLKFCPYTFQNTFSVRLKDTHYVELAGP